jgi:hypothetical protein
MFQNLGGHKVIAAVRYLAFWGGLFVMFALFIVLINDGLKIPQREVAIKIDVTNKVNICVSEDEDFAKRSFFEF